MLKGQRVNLVRTAPMGRMEILEIKAREVHPDLRAMLDFKDSKVSKARAQHLGLNLSVNNLSVNILPVFV